jgi:hypothetical protein
VKKVVFPTVPHVTGTIEPNTAMDPFARVDIRTLFGDASPYPVTTIRHWNPIVQTVSATNGPISENFPSSTG